MVLTCKRPNPRGAYIAPKYKQAKAIAWQYLKDFSRDIPGVQFNESELRAIYPNGAEIRLLGAAEPDSLRGLYLDAAVCDEMAQFSPRAWKEIIRPALADRRGSAMLIGTVFGRANLFYDYWMASERLGSWNRVLLSCHDTDALDAEEIAEMKAMLDEGEFAQEMECDWDAAVKGSYFGKLMNLAEKEERCTNVPHDPDMLVHTSWDLGMADSTVVTCWQRTRMGEVRAIECLEFQNTGLDEIVRELRTRPYNYGKHIFPHDVKVRELGTGKSRVEVLRSLGIEPLICRNVRIEDGISAVRGMLPRVWFDREKCFRLIEALKTYRSEWNDDRQVFNKQPAHTWESHFCDSVRYFALMEQSTDTAGYAAPLDFSELNRAVM